MGLHQDVAAAATPQKGGGGETFGNSKGGPDAIEREAKRPRLADVDSEADLLKALLSALDRARDVSSTGREMLKRMARGCLGTPARRRHDTQVQVAAMLREVLEGVAGDLRSAADASKARAADAAAGEVLRREELQTKKEAAATHQRNMKALQADWARDNLALENARNRLDAAKAERERLDGEWLMAGERRTALASGMEAHVEPLLTGIDDDVAREVSAKEVENLAVRAKLERSLLDAFTVAARKHPRLREQFDSLIFGQVRAGFKQHSLELEALANSPPEGAQERAVAIDTAQAGLKAARVQMAVTAKALRAAEFAIWEAEGILDGAGDALEEAAAIVDAAGGATEEDTRSLDDFLGGAMAAFEVLEGREDEVREHGAVSGVADVPTPVRAAQGP
uniref:Uncharacterized protein n=1 Tax=Zooxanthella nutricula TaxID=1333877 RepID=A0A7S2QND2_9DINO